MGRDKAYLWTDGRYFIQAANELSGSGIELMKMATPGYPTIEKWLEENVKENQTLGFDGRVISVKQYETYKNIADRNKFKIAMDKDLLEEVWINRPQLPKEKIFNHDEIFCGKSTKKIRRCKKNMIKKEADSFILSSLDDIAWLYNIRGNDVLFNPVALSYALITRNEAKLYIDLDKVTEEVKTKLNSEG